MSDYIIKDITDKEKEAIKTLLHCEITPTKKINNEILLYDEVMVYDFFGGKNYLGVIIGIANSNEPLYSVWVPDCEEAEIPQLMYDTMFKKTGRSYLSFFNKAKNYMGGVNG